MIEVWLQAMKEDLVFSGIPETWVLSVKDAEKVKEIFHGPYQEYCKIYALLDDEKWAYYEMQGVTGTREQGLLADAKRQLRRAWQAAFGKTKHDKEPGASDPSSTATDSEAS